MTTFGHATDNGVDVPFVIAFCFRVFVIDRSSDIAKLVERWLDCDGLIILEFNVLLLAFLFLSVSSESNA